MKWVVLGSGLLWALVACSGKTSSGQTGTAGAGDSSNQGVAGSVASGATGAGQGGADEPSTPSEANGPPRDDHTPIGFVPACTRPQQVAPTELGSEVQLGNELLRESDHDCAWKLGEPYELPLSPDDPPNLILQFDVNADGVDDLFFGDIAIGDLDGQNRTMVLLTSRLDGKVLSFERTACDAPWPTPNRSYFLRDLNDDGVLDFVIGRRDGISAVLNLPGSHPEVLHYDFPPSSKPEYSRVALMDLATGDFDADGRLDLAVAYDRTSIEAIYTLGTLLFRNRSASGTYGGPDSLAYAPMSLSSNEATWMPASAVAAVPTASGGAELYTLRMVDSLGTLADRYGDNVAFLVSDPPSSPTFMGSTRYGDLDTLAIGGGKALHLYGNPGLEPLLRVPCAFEHYSPEQEFGGGFRRRGFFLVDVDGDGDDDFVEYGRVLAKVETYDELWIHSRTSSTEFAPAIALQPMVPSALSESPFVRVGAFGKRLVVDGMGPRVWPLVCAP
jgi:hypothetical protein